jgi:hypothetical protein
MRFKKSSIVVVVSVFLFTILIPALSQAEFKRRTKKRVKGLEEQVANLEESVTALQRQSPEEPDLAETIIGAVIEVDVPTYDFHQVPEGQIVRHDFRVFNRGTASLEIKNVKPG